MKRLLLPLLFLILFSAQKFVPAQDTADSLLPPVVLKPIPEEWGDDKRLWQGIPSMTLAPNGRLWACWYTGGTTEGNENYVLLVSSNDKGKTWTKPLLAIDVPGPVRCYDPSMWTDPDGNVYLFWAQSNTFWDGRSGTWYIKTSNGNDENPQWSEPKRACDGIMMCKPIVDSKGRYILPASVWNILPDHPDRTLQPGAHFVVSEDKGKTWKSIGLSTVPREYALFDEHNIIEKKDGSFWLLQRTKNGMSDSVSTDGGKTWSEAKPAYPHTSSRFFVRRLKSGNLIFVKHGAMDEKTPKRSHLQAYISDDDGKTWKGGLMLDERTGVSYPDGDQTPDGIIYIIYDYNRYSDKEILLARITEEDVLAGKIVSKDAALQLLVNKSTAITPPRNPLIFTPNQNQDGKPLLKGGTPAFDLQNAEVDTFKKGVKLFGDRDNYLLKDYLPALDGKKFIRSKSIRNTDTVTCKTPGVVYVYTPLPNRNKDNIVDYLLKNGFEKVAAPEVLLFGDYTGNIATLYQKQMKQGETLKFGCWGVLVY